jgi:hypothetical protein
MGLLVRREGYSTGFRLRRATTPSKCMEARFHSPPYVVGKLVEIPRQNGQPADPSMAYTRKTWTVPERSHARRSS